MALNSSSILSGLSLVYFIAYSASAHRVYEHSSINYSEHQSSDMIHEHFSDVRNLANWSDTDASGYLEDFLKAFNIPVESQVLVFSKTSLQANKINPTNPRAIYFNDDIYVAWVPGSKLLEISVPSPHVGTNFYSLLSRQNAPELKRETHRCLRCHGDTFTREIPGLFVRSVFPDSSGEPIYRAGTELVNANTPIENRWGGWLVTGSTFPHRGNKLFSDAQDGARLLKEFGLSDIPELGYPIRRSDVVALLILDHQTHAHTLIANLAIETRKAIHEQKIMDEILQREEMISASTQSRIKSQADRLIKYLFFSKEAELPKVQLRRSQFAKKFQSNRPSDTQGKSLYDLRMNGRMFEFPLSYIVYSRAFNELPELATEYLWQEIERILKSSPNTNGYEHLSQDDKRNIEAILSATHPRYKTHALKSSNR